MPLTAKQLQTLRLVADRQISGAVTDDGRRIFRSDADGTVCTAAVMALNAKALVSILLLSNMAAVTLSERGRAILLKEMSPCR